MVVTWSIGSFCVRRDTGGSGDWAFGVEGDASIFSTTSRPSTTNTAAIPLQNIWVRFLRKGQ